VSWSGGGDLAASPSRVNPDMAALTSGVRGLDAAGSSRIGEQRLASGRNAR
jgi:hypothetical protein